MGESHAMIDPVEFATAPLMLKRLAPDDYEVRIAGRGRP